MWIERGTAIKEVCETAFIGNGCPRWDIVPKQGLPIVLWGCIGEGVANDWEKNLHAHVTTNRGRKAEHYIYC